MDPPGQSTAFDQASTVAVGETELIEDKTEVDAAMIEVEGDSIRSNRAMSYEKSASFLEWEDDIKRHLGTLQEGKRALEELLTLHEDMFIAYGSALIVQRATLAEQEAAVFDKLPPQNASLEQQQHYQATRAAQLATLAARRATLATQQAALAAQEVSIAAQGSKFLKLCYRVDVLQGEFDTVKIMAARLSSTSKSKWIKKKKTQSRRRD